MTDEAEKVIHSKEEKEEDGDDEEVFDLESYLNEFKEKTLREIEEKNKEAVKAIKERDDLIADLREKLSKASIETKHVVQKEGEVSKVVKSDLPETVQPVQKPSNVFQVSANVTQKPQATGVFNFVPSRRRA